MRVFVTYSARCGRVTYDRLVELEDYLRSIEWWPYIDLLHNVSTADPQRRVIEELLRADLQLIILTPSLERSPWAQFELGIGEATNKRRIRIGMQGTSQSG